MVDQSSYFSQYASNLVQTSIHNSLGIVGNTSSLAKDVISQAVRSSDVTKSGNHEFDMFSEKMSLKIISQCLSANLYANKAAQEIISSVMDTLNGLPVSTFYKAEVSGDDSDNSEENRLSKDLIHFVDAISSHIFYDAAKDLVRSVNFNHLEYNDVSSYNHDR